MSSVSAWRAANRLILYRYGVGSRENGEVGASADQMEGRKTETTPAYQRSMVPRFVCSFIENVLLFRRFLACQSRFWVELVSDSDAGEAGSVMNSTAEGSSPVEPQGGDVGSSALQFPLRFFAANSYPTALHLNIYSKANIIGVVAASLQGSPDMDFLPRSQFGKLFQLLVVRCQNSTKLIDSDADEAPGSTMWNKLFDTTLGGITVSHVLEMLRNPFLAGWKRVPLALIALVDGVVCCNNKTLNLTPRYVEMLGDIETLLSYPWGRESFLVTLSRFLPPPDPTACKDTVTILGVQDILAVEADAAISGRVLKDEKPGGGTVHRRNLCPRKPVVVNCKDESLSGDGGPEGPPQTGGCTHEDLKPWIAEQLKKLSTEFKHHLGEMEKNICRRLGVPEDTINKSRKRKANEDNHGQSESQISGGKKTRSPVHRAKKQNRRLVV
ncbi:hypothetical protein DY000_02006292 [Brassica cretica]|uniref:DUF1985 domain-containing protein n=1 Tax=Brassica cretica TaxID=69181 RepID=A0ABQ7CI60_BRACR|nr:hypothetical protein DY000_02006292 [Brassica cretica]